MVRKLFCAECGYTLKHSQKAYHCRKAENHGGERCFAGMIYEKDLYPKVLGVVKEILGKFLAENKPKRTISEKAKFERKRNNLEERKRDMFDSYADGFISFETYEVKVNELNAQISAVENHISVFESNSALTASHFGNESPLSKIKRLYEAETLTREQLNFIEKITVRSANDYDIVPDGRDPLTILCSSISIYDGDGFVQKI